MKEVLGIKLFNVEEASKMLGLSAFTIKLMLRDGRLKGRKIGKAWVVPEDSIKDFIYTTLPQTDNSRTVGGGSND